MGQTLGSAADLLGTVENVFMLLAAAGCAGVGWTAVRRPREPVLIMRGRPVWLVRAWGLGYVVLGVGLAAEEVGRLVGEEPAWPMPLIRWIAGPLVVLPLLAGAVWRWWERRTGRAAGERGKGRVRTGEPSGGGRPA